MYECTALLLVVLSLPVGCWIAYKMRSQGKMIVTIVVCVALGGCLCGIGMVPNDNYVRPTHQESHYLYVASGVESIMPPSIFNTYEEARRYVAGSRRWQIYRMTRDGSESPQLISEGSDKLFSGWEIGGER